jgi:outer membrane receptor protein involved in Fe transport
MGQQYRLALLAACAGIISVPAWAADQETNEIVVTGQGLAAAPGDAAYDVITIDKDRLEMSASGRMEDILRDAAGFEQFRRSDSRSAHPTSQGATLRGLGGNASTRALILLDGVPMIDPFGGWVSWSALDPSRIGSIRVTRGGGSGVFGPGALAGTIELFSPTPDQAAPVDASLAYGSRNSIDADAAISGKLGNGFAMVTGGFARGDGFIPIIASQRGPIDRPAKYREGRYSARAVFPINDVTEFQANGAFLIDQRDRGVPFTGNSNVAFDSSVRLVGHGKWGWEASSWLQTRNFSSGFASIGAGRATVTESLDQYNVPALGIGGRVEIRPPVGDKASLRFGGDARHVTGQTEERVFSTNANRFAGGQQTIYGGFADASYQPLDSLTLTASGRVDRWELRDGHRHEINRGTGQIIAANTVDYPDRSGTETTGRVGASWTVIPTLTTRVAAYSGWRLPTLNELYRPFRAGLVTTNANPALNPERVKGVEGGFDFHPLPGWRLGFTYFYNQLDDAIGNVTTALNVQLRENLDHIRSRGVEVDTHATIGEWLLQASYTHIDPKVRATGAAAATDGLLPAQTPRDQAAASIEWNRPGFARIGTTLRYVGNQFEDDLNTRVLRHAFTIDAVASGYVGKGFTVEVRGENLSNTLVQATIGTDGTIERATPRTLWIALKYRMK